MRLKTLLCIIIAGVLTACNPKPTVEIRDDFKRHFEQYQVGGSFVLLDQKNKRLIQYNPLQYHQTFTPASTFKICNSLIGLETGVIEDENFTMPWDGVERRFDFWNRDHNLQSAFKNSAVWYYQELARRVGEADMKHWLERADYGNADISGGIDAFWLTGGLRISPAQQIDFLERLYENKLPFSKRSVDIVKKIMIAKENPDYMIRAKSGWGFQDELEIGWYVGYLETKDNVYFFASCMQTPDPEHEHFAAARIEITYSILRELKLIEE